MKFAKELDEQAIAEWRKEYMNYKEAKKKLKAVRRAVRSVPASIKTESTPGNSLADAPVSALLRRRRQSSLAPSAAQHPRIGHVRSYSDSHEAVFAPLSGNGAASKPQPIGERSPLRPRGGAQQDGQNQPQMTSYGSIIGSPPHSDEVTRFNSRQAPSVELPPPAVSDGNEDYEEYDDDEDEDEDDEDGDDVTLSPTSPRFSRRPPRVAQPVTRAATHGTADSPELHPPPTQMAHTGNAYEIRAPHDQNIDNTDPTNPRLRNMFAKRTTSTPSSRPFMKRVLTGGATSSHAQDGNDVALEAYREVDFRRAEFFLFLDKELMKVEKFYHDKEEEAKSRLENIRGQLHIMREYRLQEIMKEEEERERERERSDSDQQMNGRASSKEQDGAKRKRKRDIIAKPFAKSIDFAASHLDKVRPGHIGKTSRSMGDLGSPEISQAHWLPDPSQKDYAKRAPQDVPYRVAKRKMKQAMAEFYRGLELLKSYALLNRTAFRKINKKYDKCVKAKPPLQYLNEKVAESHFVTSEVPELLMAAVEDLYARYFEKGNRKVAVSKLRTKMAHDGEFSGAVARGSAMLAAGSVFGVLGLVKGVELLFTAEVAKATYTSYLLQLYAGYFMMVLLALLFCVAAGLFNKYRVNYQFIFELDNRRALHWLQLLEIPAFLYFLLGVIMWLNFDIQAGGNTMFIYWIVVLVGLAVASFFLPVPTFYHKARGWFIYTMWRILFAGLYPVEFRDFLTGDMLCSLTYSIGNIEIFFCLFAGGNWNTPTVCNSGHSRLLGFLTCLPGIWRACQCLRRYYDTRAVFPHLVNCLKYMFTMAQYMTLSLYRIDQSLKMKAIFILFAICNGVFTSVWDLFMDWSLGDFYARHRFLRPTLAFRKHVWMYYVAMVLDPILRFNWIFYAIYTSDTQHSSIVSFLVSLSEVLRRATWTLFRVENEHCTNVENAKASRDVPLPYKLPDGGATVCLVHASNEQNSDEERLPGVSELDPTAITGSLVPKASSATQKSPSARLGSPHIRPKPDKTPYPTAPKSDRPNRVATSEISKFDLNGTERQNASNQSTKSASGREVDLERQQTANSFTLRFRRGAGGKKDDCGKPHSKTVREDREGIKAWQSHIGSVHEESDEPCCSLERSLTHYLHSCYGRRKGISQIKLMHQRYGKYQRKTCMFIAQSCSFEACPRQDFSSQRVAMSTTLTA
ncbi:Protein SYG1-like protein [Cercospora zeina]